MVLVALAPALYLFDAGGAVITEDIDGYANVFRTASADLRLGAIVQTSHGQVPPQQPLEEDLSVLRAVDSFPASVLDTELVILSSMTVW